MAEDRLGGAARRRRWRVVAASLVLLAAGGCASDPRIPYTHADALAAEPVGYDHVRVWLDGDAPIAPDFGPSAQKGQPATYLALSGGGGNGAYGAGILNGWTQSGGRPTFTAVSGVSTGALIAPFAFLGPQYDATVRDIYTSGDAGTLVETPNLLTVAFGSSLFGKRKLLDLVSSYVDDSLVAAIAREQAAGRRLYVVTTNVDSKRGVVWSIGAIAASDRPDRVQLIRQVLAASASVPLAFAPQLIDAEANGHRFQEMHVDGNVTTAVFTLPLQYLAAQKHTRLTGGRIFILMNTNIEPKFAVVERSTLPIVTASIDTLTGQKALEDLAATYAYAKANRVDFNLTAISPSLDRVGAGSFDTAYMRRLYDVGYRTGATGTFWRKMPPAAGENLPEDASGAVASASPGAVASASR